MWLVKKRKSRNLLIIAICLVAYLVHSRLAAGGGFLNRGVSFGWMNSGMAGWMQAGALVILILFLLNKHNVKGGWVIVVGGVGNFVDRIRFDGVRDYWKLGWGLYNNLNDWLIAIGVVWLLVGLWKQQSKLSTKKTELS